MAFSSDFGHQINAQYTIKTKSISYCISGWKQILKDVNCEVKPGEITAIAGPSGAGKTTLLQILAGDIPPSRFSGQVAVNDHPMNPTVFRRVSGYVTQEDLLFPNLTVEETLLYSARLKLHGGLDKAKSRVSDLLVELGLCHVAGERAGGISGGEKRRVSIGVDLVHDPSVLLMDEPTSGLDSSAALQVMSMLGSMAKDHRKKTIVVTIHQPGFRILDLLDQVMLLVDGTMVHHGSLDHLRQRLNIAGHGSIPHQVNVLEFSMEVIETLIPEVKDFATTCDQLDLDDHLMNVTFVNTPFTEVMILSQRFCYNIFRTKELFIAKTVQAVLVSIILGTIFKDIDRFQMQTQIGFFAFNLTFLLNSSTESLPIFLQERRIVMKETSNGAYRISSYIFANTLVFIPLLLIVALLYTVPIYLLVGLRKDLDGFLYFSLVVWLALLVSNSFVACFSTVVPNFVMGISLVVTLMGSFFLFSGYFISNHDIPRCWILMHYMSLFRYPFESFLLNEFGGSEGQWRCVERFGDGCLINGEEFLKSQNLKEIQKWHNLGIMLVFIFAYRFVSFLVLSCKSHRSRH